MQELTITEVARQAGVRTSTIRYYESIQVLPMPQRVAGRRRYDPAVIDRLAFIQITQQLGFSLAEIQRLFQHGNADTPLPELWQTLARQKLVDVDRLIRHALDVKRMLAAGLGCGCPTMHDCIACVRERCEGRESGAAHA